MVTPHLTKEGRMQILWWFVTACTPGADKVVGLQSEVEDFEGEFFEVARQCGCDISGCSVCYF